MTRVPLSTVSGAAVIAINEALFISAQSSLAASHTAFDATPGTPHDSTSEAATLKLYREQFIELANVLQLYRELIAKDIKIIQKAHDNITETDSALSAGAGR